MSDEPQTRLSYGMAEAAELLGVGRTTIYGLIRSGQLPTLKIGQRRLVTHDDLQTFMAERRTVGCGPEVG